MKALLTINEQEAKVLYPEAGPVFKDKLETHFTKPFFSANIMDRIKSFADICIEAGTTEEAFFAKCVRNELSIDEIACRQAKLICKILNEDWIPDYNNLSQAKWNPLAYLNKPGFRLSASSNGRTASDVGPRLVFKDEKTCVFAFELFEKVYENLIGFGEHDLAPKATKPETIAQRSFEGVPPTFEAACQSRGYDPATVIPDLTCYPERHRAALDATARLFIINEATKKGEKLDYDDDDQDKYYPYFDLEVDENNPSGFRLYATFSGLTFSGVGPRLSLLSEEDVRETAKIYEPLYKALMTE